MNHRWALRRAAVLPEHTAAYMLDLLLHHAVVVGVALASYRMHEG